MMFWRSKPATYCSSFGGNTLICSADIADIVAKFIADIRAAAPGSIVIIPPELRGYGYECIDFVRRTLTL